MAKGTFTIDHETIRQWAEERDGHPARVKTTGKKDGGTGRSGGVLRIDFGEPETSLETISWEEFFEAFETNNLAFLYQNEIDGKKSRFFKFVDRGNVKDKLEGEGETESDDGEEDDDEEKEEEESALADDEDEDEDDDSDEDESE